MNIKVKTYSPILADWGEPDMQQDKNGAYVEFYDYAELYKKYIRARSALNKEKIKAKIKNA
jgi:hypothetical protein